jgi:Fe-S-cluster-containing dehydrogenase component
MKKWNLVFDVALCTGCQNCVLAVKDEYVGNSFKGYSAEMTLHGANWVEIRRRERGSFPVVDVAHLFQCCQHCDEAPCLAAARNGAVRKRGDGIVVIDPVAAKGQRQIAEACPYGAVQWNEALSLPQHWNFDAHLIDAGWSAPRPVQVFPTAALRALNVEDAEMQRIAAAEGLERLSQGSTHGTRVYYRNLSRYRDVFIGGTLVGNEGALESCVADAEIVLLRGAEPLGGTSSDDFGDFRFDALPPSSGKYRVEVRAVGYRTCQIEFELENSVWLGEIRLDFD